MRAEQSGDAPWHRPSCRALRLGRRARHARRRARRVPRRARVRRRVRRSLGRRRGRRLEAKGGCESQPPGHVRAGSSATRLVRRTSDRRHALRRGRRRSLHAARRRVSAGPGSEQAPLGLLPLRRSARTTAATAAAAHGSAHCCSQLERGGNAVLKTFAGCSLWPRQAPPLVVLLYVFERTSRSRNFDVRRAQRSAVVLEGSLVPFSMRRAYCPARQQCLSSSIELLEPSEGRSARCRASAAASNSRKPLLLSLRDRGAWLVAPTRSTVSSRRGGKPRAALRGSDATA